MEDTAKIIIASDNNNGHKSTLAPSPSSSSTPHEDNIINASTEVLVDSSISERLNALGLCGEEPDSKIDEEESTTYEIKLKPEKDAETSRLILAGELSDNSECSVDVEEEEASDHANDKLDLPEEVSDEEMFIEEQDEDVEEEEEFHEVEEEKYKTSQESVDKVKALPSANTIEAREDKSKPISPPSEDKAKDEAASAELTPEVAESNLAQEKQDHLEKPETVVAAESKTEEAPQKTSDWADIMLSSNGQENDVSAECVSVEKDATEEKSNEEESKKELDLDEDVKNPQYIPKKGVFYEHDDRSGDVAESDEASKKPPIVLPSKEEGTPEVKDSTGTKKAATPEKLTDNRRNGRRQRSENDRWNHDLFKDERQKPKSKNELITAYGYDIRTNRNSSNVPKRQQDDRLPNQAAPSNRSKDRRSRRPNNRNNVTKNNQIENMGKNRQEPTEVNRRDRGTRFVNRRQNSRDRPSSDEKLPPITTVMPPITTWSNQLEDVTQEDANQKGPSPPRQQSENLRSRPSNDQWPQGQGTKPLQQHHTSRRHQDREESHDRKLNQFNTKPIQHQNDWRRTNNHSNIYIKSNEYEPIKTQTFENSRLAQANSSRSHFRDSRDAREIINERRLQNHQSFYSKVQPNIFNSVDHQIRHQQPHQHHHHQQHQHPIRQQQQQLHHQQPIQQQNSQHLRQHQPRQPLSIQPPQMSQQQPITQRQPLINNSVLEGDNQEAPRLNLTNSGNNDSVNSRPIVKTDTYSNAASVSHQTQSLPPQQQQQQQQSHRPVGGHMTLQESSTTTAHLLPSHLGAATQYYAQSGGSRESAAAALASAYHGYIPGGHSVMDTSRYHHLASQQLTDHSYMNPPTQTSNVASGSVLHSQGLYSETNPANGTVPNSAYMTQAGSALSPSTNIPVTGAGPPALAQASYLQHSQYAPPPYSNHYPQHNQAPPPPPQSTHAYPYWTYI